MTELIHLKVKLFYMHSENLTLKAESQMFDDEVFKFGEEKGEGKRVI